MFHLRVALSLLGFVIASLYGVAIAVVRRDRSLVARDYARMLARWMRPPLGLRVAVEGREHLTDPQPCIYIANHQSALDAPVLAGLFPANTVLVAKQEVRRIPLFGWLYEVTGNILIDRTHNPSAVGRMREAERAILERGVSIWIFPEGTRGRVPGRLLPFKKGAFYMAVATGVPLVPVVVSPLRPIFDAGRRILHPGTVRVRVLEPIPTRGLSESDVPGLIETAHCRMQAALSSWTDSPPDPARQALYES